MADPNDLLAQYADADPASFFRNPGLDLLRRRPPVDAKNYDGFNPLWDILLGTGEKDGPNAPKRQQFAYSRSEPVLPSRQFWEDLGAGPAWTERMGQAQATAMGGGNALLFGVPMAAMRRFAPETARRAQDVIDQNYYAGMAGEIAGTVGNPANTVYRKAGEHLANKGYGLLPQATADAMSVAAIHSLPAAIEYGEMAPTALSSVAPVAFWSRMIMPKLPENILKRAAYGAGAGLVAGSNPGAGTFAPIPEIMTGALYGASGRAPKTQKPHANKWDEFVTNDRGRSAAMVAGGLGGTLKLASMVDMGKKDKEPTTAELLEHFYGDTSGKP